MASTAASHDCNVLADFSAIMIVIALLHVGAMVGVIAGRVASTRVIPRDQSPPDTRRTAPAV